MIDKIKLITALRERLAFFRKWDEEGNIDQINELEQLLRVIEKGCFDKNL